MIWRFNVIPIKIPTVRQEWRWPKYIINNCVWKYHNQILYFVYANLKRKNKNSYSTFGRDRETHSSVFIRNIKRHSKPKQFWKKKSWRAPTSWFKTYNVTVIKTVCNQHNERQTNEIEATAFQQWCKDWVFTCK